ncbi:E3 ubiquitin-protein ligase TRIM71-like [Dysidea avara]|uniref:E3 ubiquitin-protein ligase TRIM71-like n=1 Tax=Dysidea avara TaxID=196820 RepID=UPI00333230DF
MSKRTEERNQEFLMALRKATENLSCPVCYQLFRSPKYLPCYHSYCEDCLNKIQKDSKIICPECRKQAVLPSGGVKELPNNFLITRLVEELVLNQKVKGEVQAKCDKCDEDDPVVVYCLECSLFFCNICNQAHIRDRESRGHEVVPLTELRYKRDLHVQPKPKVPLCSKDNIELILYCETCEELICTYCAMKEHSQHEHNRVSEVITKHHSHLKQVTAPLDKMISDLTVTDGNICQLDKNTTEHGEEVTKQVDQHYDEVIKKIEEQREEVKQHIRDTVSRNKKTVQSRLEEVQSSRAEVMSMKTLVEVVEKSSHQEVLSAKKQVISRMLELSEECERLNTQPIQLAAIEFVPTTNPLPCFGQIYTNAHPHTSEVQNLPEYTFAGKTVDFTIITKDAKGNCCSASECTISVLLESSAQIQDNNDGSYIASFVPQQVGKTQLSVSLNGQQIKESPYNIIVSKNYTALKKPSRVLSRNDGVGNPWGIAFGKDGMWAVTNFSDHCVYIFDHQDQLIKTFGTNGGFSGQFEYPVGVSFDGDNHLHVADLYNHRVQKFDINGTYLLQYGGRGTEDGRIASPRGIVACGDRIYVAEDGNGRISVFQCLDGEFCFTIGKGQLGNPYDVAVCNNQLLVADYSHNCIYVFMLNGNFVHTLGTQGNGIGQLNNPWSITTDINGFVLIAEFGNHRVSVFDKFGNCIHCFSTSSDGRHFNGPYGIALSPNSNIYVCDGNSQKIDVFSNF